jgi:hypothetical protein
MTGRVTLVEVVNERAIAAGYPSITPRAISEMVRQGVITPFLSPGRGRGRGRAGVWGTEAVDRLVGVQFLQGLGLRRNSVRRLYLCLVDLLGDPGSIIRPNVATISCDLRREFVQTVAATIRFWETGSARPDAEGRRVARVQVGVEHAFEDWATAWTGRVPFAADPSHTILSALSILRPPPLPGQTGRTIPATDADPVAQRLIGVLGTLDPSENPVLAWLDSRTLSGLETDLRRAVSVIRQGLPVLAELPYFLPGVGTTSPAALPRVVLSDSGTWPAAQRWALLVAGWAALAMLMGASSPNACGER